MKVGEKISVARENMTGWVHARVTIVKTQAQRVAEVALGYLKSARDGVVSRVKSMNNYIIEKQYGKVKNETTGHRTIGREPAIDVGMRAINAMIADAVADAEIGAAIDPKSWGQ